MIRQESSTPRLSLSPFAGSSLARCNWMSRAAAPTLQALGAIACLALFCLLAAVPALGQTLAASNSIQAPAATNILAVHTPTKVTDGTATRVSHYNPEQMLRLALAIQPPHMAEEQQFIQQLVTKGSPNFHKFLTPEEWNARFAPSAEDEQAVVDWATSQGLTVTRRYPNRLIVDVEGKAGVIEKAFGVTINNYQVGDEVDFSNDRDPVIPANLSGILHEVLGLQSIERAHRLNSRKPTVKGPDYVAGPAISLAFSKHGNGDPTKAPWNRAASEAASNMSNPTPSDSFPLDDRSGTYAMDPDNIQSSEAYDFNAFQKLSHCCNEPGDSAGSPPESSIALVGYGNFNDSDVETFFGAYGMAYYFYAYYINGSGFPGVDGEAPLDVEYSGAMSNSYGSYLDTARIYEYEMPNGLYATYADAFEAIDSDNYADVVSTSYGWEENVGFSGTVATGTMEPIFMTMTGEGRTLIASSGDSGASAGCGDATAPVYPSTDPDFIAAGGTELTLNDSGIYVSELGWQGEDWTGGTNDNNGACANNHGGSTGGVSVLFAAPFWQTITNSTYPTGVESPYYEWIGSTDYIVTGNTNRLTPDISLTANPDVLGEWYYSGGSWQDEGGTSIVAPELAGFFAQENSYLDYIGNKCGSGSSACSPVGNAAPFIYYDAIFGAPHNPFYDMVGGSDGTGGCSNNDITAKYGLVYFCTYSGYDLVTGWGSANMLQLAWGINWELIPAIGSPSIAFSGPTTGSGTWYNADQEISWTVSDAGSGGYPAPGVAGFTQGWDSIPSDPSTEPHGGDGNSFYSGPQYAFGTSGCLSFNGLDGCAAAASPQGCHTAHVEAWDNQGRTATNTYGPVCYDTVDPTIADSTNPATSLSVWVDQSVVVTLTATDPGGSNASGIYKTYYGGLNSNSCYPGSVGTCNVYTGPFTVSTQGQNYIYYFTEDNAGNYSTEPYQWISIDETLPVTTSSLSGTIYSGSTYETAVQVTLSATDSGPSGVKATYYELDGGTQTTYSGAFTVSTLGSHSVKYWSVSNSGETESAHTIAFTVDSPTTATLVASPNPSLFGQSVLMTATVTATLSGTPTGSVTFYNGATSLGAGTLSGGVATLSTTALPAGALTLQATYAGAGNFLATNSAPYDQTVDQAPAMTTPTPGSTLSGSAVTFDWSAGVGPTKYTLNLGTTGAGSYDVYHGATTTALSAAVTGIPTGSGTIYAQLNYYLNSVWYHINYTYSEFGTVTPPALTTPTPGTELSGSAVTFDWSAGVGPTKYTLNLGTTGAGSYDVYHGATTTALSAAVTGIPTGSGTLYAQLNYYLSGTWYHINYTYAEFGTPTVPALTTPTPGSTLSGSAVTFDWSPGVGPTKYSLNLGTTGAGSYDVYHGATTTALSAAVTGIPTGSGTIYAQLNYYESGTWYHINYTYVEAATTASQEGGN
ncbi:MAG: protease pro-enzyme activation domain-containing protein [Terracidiphilus sp.]